MLKKSLILITGLFIIACSGGEETKEDINTASQSEAPYLFTDINGLTYLTWTETGEDGHQLKLSELQDTTWLDPQTIAMGTDWFTNWADYPVVATDGKHFLAHYLKKSGKGTYSYDVMLKHSNDGGKKWSSPFKLHDDNKKAEHGFVTTLPYQGNFFVTWLDGRNTVTDDTTSHHGSGGPMTLRAAVISKDGEKLNEWELDDRVCDCCQTTAAITDNGPVVVYRDRSNKEVRDMSVVRLENNKWSSPETLHEDNWEISGCPVNGPRMSAIGNNLAVGWFSAANANATVKIKFSHDGGNTFGPAIKVSQSNPIGRVDVEMIDEITAVISWMEGSEIVASKVTDTGRILHKYTVANSSEARGSGFPQMTINAGKLIFAWTNEESKSIKTRIMEL